MRMLLGTTCALALGVGVIASSSSVQASEWDGIYLGGTVGGGGVVTGVNLNVPPAGIDVDFNGFGGEGFVGGGYIGYNRLVSPKILVGVEFQGLYSDIQTELDVVIPVGPGATANAEVEYNPILSASARLGYLLTPRALIYALGGYSYTEADASIAVAAGAVGAAGPFAAAASADLSFDGAHFGTGIEVRIGSRLTARAEYRYFDFEDRELFGSIVDISPSMHVGTVGLAYNFFDPFARSSIEPVADLEPVEPEYSWTGFYFGGRAGGGASITEVDVAAGAVFASSFNGIGGEGLTFGGFVGADYQILPRVVVGAEAAINFAELPSELDINGPALAAIGAIAAEGKLEYLLQISGRAGYLINPATLAYALGGYSNASFEGTLNIAAPTGVNLVADQNFDGFHVGGGLEARVNEQISLRAEYRYTQFSEANFFGGVLGIEPSLHTGTIGAAYRF